MNEDTREAAAHAAAPVWNPSADAPSPPRFRPKLKSSLPRVLLQDNRSLSINLERKLTNLLKARARVESRWESNKRKLIVSVRSSHLLDAQRRASWAPAAAAEAAAAEAEMAAAARRASANGRSHLVSRQQVTPSCRQRDGCAGELADANAGATASDWHAPKPAAGERDSPNWATAAAGRPPVPIDGTSVQLPLIYGSPKLALKACDDSAPRSTPPPPLMEQQRGQQRGQQQHLQRQRQQSDGEPLELTAEEQQPQLRGSYAQAAPRIASPPLRLRHLSLDNSFSSRATLAFSRSLTLAAPAAAVPPPAPGRLQYDIHHQIEEEDRLVAFLTFRAKPRVANAGRQVMGV